MSVQNNTCTLYDSPIHSIEDVEALLNNNEWVKEKVSGAIDARFNITIETFENYLDVGDLFKTIYQESIGCSTSQKAINKLNDYKLLLQECFTACSDLTPLFVTSLQCHQTAFRHMGNAEGAQREASITAAAAAMAKAQELRAQVANKYSELQKKYRALDCAEVLVSLVNDQLPMYQQKRAVEEEVLDTAIVMIQLKPDAEQIGWSNEPLRDKKIALQCIEKMIGFVDKAIKSAGRLHTAVADVDLFWNRAARYAAANAVEKYLANPKMLGIFMEPPTAVAIEFCTSMQQAAAVLDEEHQVKTGQSMKTGRDQTLPAAPKLVQLLRPALQPLKAHALLDQSYFNSLAFAKINHAATAALRRTIVEIEKVQEEILLMEKDPLVMALQSHENSA